MKNLLLITAACLLGSASIAQKRNDIYYTVSFPNAIHHEAEIL
jgi:hypothetical protein